MQNMQLCNHLIFGRTLYLKVFLPCTNYLRQETTHSILEIHQIMLVAFRK